MFKAKILTMCSDGVNNLRRRNTTQRTILAQSLGGRSVHILVQDSYAILNT